MVKLNPNQPRGYFNKFTISNTEFNRENPQVIFNSICSGFSLINLSDASIEYSFDGVTLHGDLIPGTPCAAIIWDNRTIPYIWFRASGGNPIVRVEAWT